MRRYSNLRGRFTCRERLMLTESSIAAFVEHRLDDKMTYRREVLGGRGTGRIGAPGVPMNIEPEKPHEPKALGAAGGKNG